MSGCAILVTRKNIADLKRQNGRENNLHTGKNIKRKIEGVRNALSWRLGADSEKQMKAVIKIQMDNAAFTNDAGIEFARILRELADHVEAWPGANKFKLNLRDINGNTVGELKVSK